MNFHTLFKAKWTTMWIMIATPAYSIVYRTPCGSECKMLYSKLIVEILFQKNETAAGIQPTRPSKCKLSFDITLDRFINRTVAYLIPPSTGPNDAGISLDHKFSPIRFPQLRSITTGKEVSR